MRPSILGLAVMICAGTASAASAGEGFGGAYGHHGVHAYGHGRTGGYGFGEPLIGGDYVGAPLTRFPRPNELVPPAWGYGTYGVPTVTGIRQAPTAAPTLTVIDGVDGGRRRPGPGPRIVTRGEDGQWPGADAMQGGVRVISVTVPRR